MIFKEDELMNNRLIFEEEDLKIILGSEVDSNGHIIIKTKENFESIEELPNGLLEKIMSIVQLCVGILKEKYNIKGYSIHQDGGEFSEKSYFHFRIIPRKDEKSFKWIYSDEENPEAFNFAEIKNNLEEELKEKFN